MFRQNLARQADQLINSCSDKNASKSQRSIWLKAPRLQSVSRVISHSTWGDQTILTNVILDNTNPDPETRAHWTEVAKELKVPIRCVYFTAPPALCRHNDAVRAANPSLVSLHMQEQNRKKKKENPACLPLPHDSNPSIDRTPNPAAPSPAWPLPTLRAASASPSSLRALRTLSE